MKLPLLLAALALLTACAPLVPAPRGEKIVRNIPYKSASGRTLSLDVYLPRGEGPHPLVFWVHGGGWKYGDKGWMLYVRELTAYGFAVSSVEYRLSGRAKFPAQYEDCRDAFRFMEENAGRFHLDPKNYYLAGASAGGHLAALLGEKVGKARANAVLAIYPATDLTGFENPSAVKGYLPELLGGSVNEKRALAQSGSPIRFVSPQSPPYLFLHGDKDTLVPIAQSERMLARLRANGVEANLVVMHGVDHNFPHKELYQRQIADFLWSHYR